MSDNNKKRGSSFRKIFPSLFFSNKSKEKTTIKHSNPKMNTDSSTSRNHYQTPQPVFVMYDNQTERQQEHDERIYENLSTSTFIPNVNNTKSADNNVLSNHSSSSTLVSENVKQENTGLRNKNETDDIKFMAIPQVPPKPQNEIYSSQYKIPYPDVYYHSLEKLTDTISPLDEIEIYRASKTHAHPASVGAEIKKVSTKFLISPKKEADVRMIQPIRARSLSPDKEKPNNIEKSLPLCKTERFLEKPYNYSAPTSPVVSGHKIPNMPTTVSPYEHVRKTMIEAEEKRNSINRSHIRTKFTQPLLPRSSSSISKSSSLSKERVQEDLIKKEKTRQKVEAFYWQKIKELKQKEDEYLLRQSLNTSVKGPRIYDRNSNSNCSTPNSFIVGSKSCSVPRGTDINSGINQTIYTTSPFIRGAPERRTDSYINNRPFYWGPEVIYRHPEKLIENIDNSLISPIQKQNINPVSMKRISAERQNYITSHENKNIRKSEPFRVKLDFGANHLKNPPQPPLRTTSVASSDNNYRLINNNKKYFNSKSAIRSLCSESESGSEAGEIQRIMESRAQKEEDWQGDPRIDGGLSDGEGSRGLTRGRPSRRDDPRRHTLAGNHNIYMHQHHPGHISTIEIEAHSAAKMSTKINPEYSTVTKYRDMRQKYLDPRLRKPPLPRYPPPNNALLFDDDPGVMSEVETSSTGFRRGGKQRSSLPVVRTPSKTLERPLGLVFLQYRNETKRALLPNEITSIDTVKALFVRSFPKQLTMQYMDSENVKIYIHENTKDMFYELEDVRPAVLTSVDFSFSSKPCKVVIKWFTRILIATRMKKSYDGATAGLRGKMKWEVPPLRCSRKAHTEQYNFRFPWRYNSIKLDSRGKSFWLCVSCFNLPAKMRRREGIIHVHDDRCPAHLRDIRDHSVLRLFEATDIGGGTFPGAMGVGSVPMPTGSLSCFASTWESEQNYFSEPEIDSDYHSRSQHVHNKNKGKPPAYYMGSHAPSTLPRGGAVLRAYSPAAPPVPTERSQQTQCPPAPPKPVRSYVPGSGSERCFPFAAAECPRGTDQLYSIPAHSEDVYMSSPERVVAPRPYEDPYYTQFLGTAAGRPPVAPVINEETNETVVIDDSYQMYGGNPITTAPRPMPRPPYDARAVPPVDDMQRLRVENMERQLANLTGLVQKALQVPGTSTAASAPPASPRLDYPTYATRPAGQDADELASNERPPKLGRDRFQKSVSFEKSVSFSDDPPDMNSPKQHSPQHSADTKPTKPAIKSSTLPRTSSQERDRLKPAPPPKPAGLVGQQMNLAPQRSYTLNVNNDFFNQLRILQKQSRDLRIETRNLRRSTLSHSVQMRQMMAEAIVKIGDLAASFCEDNKDTLAREEEIYRQDMLLLENDLYELEATVERLRGQAANRETRVNMADIERIAMVLSKSSKTVADWKLKFPILQETMKAKLAAEMEKVIRKEKLLEDEPERLELALRRCKKLTGTLVTLKRLACVQEQRLPLTEGRVSPSSSQSSATAGPSSEDYNSENACALPPNNNKGTGVTGRGAAGRGAADVRPENALDALLDELQTFSKPSERGGRGEGPLHRLHSYPSGSDTDASPPVRARGQHPPKPPVPERHPELLAMAVRRAPPPPPPRTTSRSPLASPTSPSSPPRPDSSDSNDEKTASRQALLEQRHQELLKKQKALQEQYARLQMIQRSGSTLPPNAQPDLKKTGSESNLLTKLSLNLAPASISGSMTHLAGDCDTKRTEASPDGSQLSPSDAVATTNKVYETDIL